MNNQKVCISKQATFISVIILLLIGYVLVAYQTMMNKTSTNSRASYSNEVALPTPIQITVLPPNCYNPVPVQYCLSPVYSKDIAVDTQKNLAVTSEAFADLKTDALYKTYAIVAVNKDSSRQTPYTYVIASIVSKKDIAAMTTSTYTIPAINSLLDVKKPYSYIIFGIPESTSPNTSDATNKQGPVVCDQLPPATQTPCASVKTD